LRNRIIVKHFPFTGLNFKVLISYPAVSSVVKIALRFSFVSSIGPKSKINLNKLDNILSKNATQFGNHTLIRSVENDVLGVFFISPIDPLKRTIEMI
jgi:hypothetical protein